MLYPHAPQDWAEIERHKDQSNQCEHGLCRATCPTCFLEAPDFCRPATTGTGQTKGFLEGSTSR